MGKWLNDPKDLLFEVRDHVAYIEAGAHVRAVEGA